MATLNDFLPDHDGWRAFPAPAKLNLFLHVTGRRDDGYHLLQSVFQLIDLADTIRLRLRDDGEIVRTGLIPGVPADTDLTVRAARLLQQETGCRSGVDIAIDKRLPMGGGVGGGSSDAATVLLALNRLWRLDLSRERLMQLGASLGADVPFFVFGETAFVEGIGERMRAVASTDGYFVVLHPPVHVPTPEIFRDQGLTRDTPSLNMRDLNTATTRNDLQAVAVRKHPLVGQYIAWLSRFSPARMTGSGSCVFALFASQAGADAVVSQLPRDMTGWTAKAVDRHPLKEFAG
ncbi:4-(cytidine 5'-diphospho)-2-C-methyl-D-erythritol kinase [Jeongeupia chitinilytica]|uniref:4-diphosphocytidyl-2-C-methyl-D-erythritol kinase n=1 Tax=Jeongeupia chitinilytica TaxID=1041641 RepID=A0ABQ3H004_9NEIS|nr:4-(cytidine 5'-diphospho)-2-C-methyl-D-erythritol kinase [Jeongeupia chitinilytica]GHD62017.1 4-diphosphocytidyl-2-C-methyl-D-erythritol kinase [Jeongeupia chitinilytica]